MIDTRLEKALNRFAEIGGGKFEKISEDIIRAESKVKVLKEELEENMQSEKKNDEFVRTIKVRLVIAMRELEAAKKVKGI